MDYKFKEEKNFNNPKDYSWYDNNSEEYNEMFYGENMNKKCNKNYDCCNDKYDYCYKPITSCEEQCQCCKPSYCCDEGYNCEQDYSYCYDDCNDFCDKPSCYDPCCEPCEEPCYDPCCEPCEEPCCDPCCDPCEEPCYDPCYDSCCEPCEESCYDPCCKPCNNTCCEPCNNPCYDSCCEPCDQPCYNPCDDSCYDPCCEPCEEPCYNPCCEPCCHPCEDSCYDPCEKPCCKKSCCKPHKPNPCNDKCCTKKEFFKCECEEEKGTIKVCKVLDCNGLKPLSGARINLYNIEGVTPELVSSKISDSNGIVIFDCLENGYYRVIEIVDKCMFDKPKYMPWNEIKIDKCNKKAEIKIINRIKNIKKIKGEALIEVLTDKCGCKTPLGCIEVKLFSCNKNSSKEIAKGKTDDCGKVKFKNLPEGDYRIHVNLDMCYFANIIFNPSDDFTINSKEQCVETSVYAVPRSEYKKGSVRAYSLLESVKGEAISGVKFNLYKIDGCKPELISTKYTNKQGMVEFDCLEHGTYKILEVIPSSFYPPKYIPNSDFVIDRKNRDHKIIVLNKLKCSSNRKY